jgi:hypothetical protein
MSLQQQPVMLGPAFGPGKRDMRSPGNQATPAAAERIQRYEAGRSQDGGIWRGPTKAAWMIRLLRGAAPPRESTGTTPDALVAHG